MKPACYVLLGFVAAQPLMYGQATDLVRATPAVAAAAAAPPWATRRARPLSAAAFAQAFMCRSLTLAGGLLLLIWNENERQRRSEDVVLQGLEGQGADRLQLSGRLALTSLFFFQARDEMRPARTHAAT